MLATLETAAGWIRSGKTLMVAGDQSLLSQLPKGNWIGGSIPYFIAETGGVQTKEKLFVTEISDPAVTNAVVTVHTVKNIHTLAEEAPDNGISFLILPSGSAVHLEYAKKAPGYKDMFIKPVVGWVSGMALEEIGKVQATVVDGTSGETFTDRAVALHCSLAAGKTAKVGIVNIFAQGSGDRLEFTEESFDVRDVLVNGKKENFRNYLTSKGIDTKLPLVGDFAGSPINVSFMGLDAEKDLVHLYAPVFKDIVYRIAAPVGNYPAAFKEALAHLKGNPLLFSCNCILNYLYGNLEGQTTGKVQGPVTFGEIAYQLVNQTLVYVEID